MTNIEKWLAENGYKYLENERIYFNAKLYVTVIVRTAISDFSVHPFALSFIYDMGKGDTDDQIKAYEKSNGNCLSEYRRMIAVGNPFGNVGESAESQLEGNR